VKRSEESDMMDLEPGAGDSNLPPIVIYNESTNDAIKGSEEVIPTTQLDMEMLFHKASYPSTSSLYLLNETRI
jgi:hypothetical protein